MGKTFDLLYLAKYKRMLNAIQRFLRRSKARFETMFVFLINIGHHYVPAYHLQYCRRRSENLGLVEGGFHRLARFWQSSEMKLKQWINLLTRRTTLFKKKKKKASFFPKIPLIK